jgi:hypothetical protein
VVPGHPGRGHRPCLLLVLQEGGLRLAVFPRDGALLPRVPALQLWLPTAPSLKSTTLGQLLNPNPLLRSCSCRPLICASIYVYCAAPTRGCLCCRRLNGRRCGLWGQVLHVPSAPV